MIERLNAALRHVPAWPIYIVTAGYIAWAFWLGATGRTGPEPINVLERDLGTAALQVYILSLAVTPLRRLFGLNLLRYRRAIGLSVFMLVLTHLLVWLFLDLQIWAQIWADILKRPYITVGMAAFVLLIPLALTSNNRSIRRLGAPSWARLHRLTYAAALLAAIHNVMVQKVWEVDSLAYLGAIAILLILRLPGLRVAFKGARI